VTQYSEGENVLADSSGNVYVTGYTYGDFDGNKNLGLKISSLLNITLQEQSNGLNSMALPRMMKEKASLWIVLDISTLPGIQTVGFMAIQMLDTLIYY
jgi:hypothetical protein